LSSVIAPEPKEQCGNYANILNSILTQKRYTQIHVHLPVTSYRDLMLSQRDSVKSTPDTMVDDKSASSSTVNSSTTSSTLWDPWLRWNKLRCLCQHSSSLGIALELTEDLPPEAELNRWLGEPVRTLLIPPRIFQHSSAGFKLPPPHAAFFQRLLKVTTSIIYLDVYLRLIILFSLR